MNTRTWTREQTEDVFERMTANRRDPGNLAPWYADVLDAYEDLIAVCELALEASGVFDHCGGCRKAEPIPVEERADPYEWGCTYYAEHEAVRLLNLLRGRSED